MKGFLLVLIKEADTTISRLPMDEFKSVRSKFSCYMRDGDVVI